MSTTINWYPFVSIAFIMLQNIALRIRTFGISCANYFHLFSRIYTTLVNDRLLWHCVVCSVHKSLQLVVTTWLLSLSLFEAFTTVHETSDKSYFARVQ